MNYWARTPNFGVAVDQLIRLMITKLRCLFAVLRRTLAAIVFLCRSNKKVTSNANNCCSINFIVLDFETIAYSLGLWKTTENMRESFIQKQGNSFLTFLEWNNEAYQDIQTPNHNPLLLNIILISRSSTEKPIFYENIIFAYRFISLCF